MVTAHTHMHFSATTTSRQETPSQFKLEGEKRSFGTKRTLKTTIITATYPAFEVVESSQSARSIGPIIRSDCFYSSVV